MEKTVIRVEDLSKVYKLYDRKSDRLREAISISNKKYHREFYALRDVSFEVKQGETIGIIGTNGSGKSTLLKILTGVSFATSGMVDVVGKVSALLELGAGFNPEYTGIENILLNGTMMGYSQEEMESRKEEIIRFADIGDYINQPVKNYSSGMFARLAFSVAISVDPEILIVDETLSVGDLRFQIKCMDRMRQMMENNTTILYVSHDLNSIRRFCKRTLWLSNGANMAFGDTCQVADLYNDFLKLQDEDNSLDTKEESVLDRSTEEPKNNTIAEIIGFQINYSDGSRMMNDTLRYDTPISITVTYMVYDSDLNSPVLGISLMGVNDEYICGVNTMLDNCSIPWKLGENRFTLIYPYGVCVLGGHYHFDCALEDQTATIFLDYKRRIKEFIVDSGYIAEGILSVPHLWENG